MQKLIETKLRLNQTLSRSMTPPRRLIKHMNVATAAAQLLHASEHPIVCLERSIGERFGADKTLWETGAFDAQVYPDLPFASNWSELLHKTLDTLRPNKQVSSISHSPPTAILSDSSRPIITVRTVGAQTASRECLQRKVQRACEKGPGKGNADALLFVSGSHPARALPFAENFLQSSFSMLKDASLMRQTGQIPQNVSFWAVENPINPPERLLRKIEAGAEAIITQPPFIKSSAERWFELTNNSGVLENVKLIAGIPMVSSLGNLRFWLGLCGLGTSPLAQDVLRSFPEASGLSKEAYEQEVREWNKEFILWVGKMH